MQFDIYVPVFPALRPCLYLQKKILYVRQWSSIIMIFFFYGGGGGPPDCKTKVKKAIDVLVLFHKK